MSDEIKKDEELIEQEVHTEPEAPAEAQVEEPAKAVEAPAIEKEEKEVPVEQKTEEEEEQHVEEVQNEPAEVLPESEGHDDKVPEEAEDSKPEEEAVHADDGDTAEETDKDEEPAEPEVVEEQVDVDAIKAELEELKAEKAEAEEVEALGKENARVANEFNQLCQGLGKGLEEAFEKYAIPTDKTIEELEKEDPVKAQLARNLTKQANDIIEAAKKDAEAFLNEKAHEVVFKKADRLLQKMDVSEEEAPIVAETYLDIIAQAGIRDLHEDLKAKLELAVAKAKMVVKAAGKTAGVIKEAAEVVKDHVEKVAEKIEKVEEVIKEPAKEEVKEEPKVEAPVEEIDKAEFEEGAGAKPEPASASLTVDNFLQELDKVRDLDKPAFIKANYALFEAAMKKASK